MDQIISVLFNTDHEAPGLGVIVFLVIVALVLPAVTNYFGRRRSGGQRPPEPPRNQKGKDRKK